MQLGPRDGRSAHADRFAAATACEGIPSDAPEVVVDGVVRNSGTTRLTVTAVTISALRGIRVSTPARILGARKEIDIGSLPLPTPSLWTEWAAARPMTGAAVGPDRAIEFGVGLRLTGAAQASTGPFVVDYRADGRDLRVRGLESYEIGVTALHAPVEPLTARAT